MSLYRTLLEEDEVNGVIDTNMDGAPELKEIEDVVANFDANEYEQKQAQDASFGASDDPNEGEALLDEMMIVIGESQMMDNAIMQAIGISEVNCVYENGNAEVLYESKDSIKAFFDKAKKWVVEFFKKVWSVLKRYFANLSAMIKGNNGFVKKYKAEDINAGFANFKPKKQPKGYKFDGLNSKRDAGVKVMQAVSDRAAKTISEINSGNYADQANKSADNVASDLASKRAELCGTSCEAGEFKEKLMEHFRGGEKIEKPFGDTPGAAILAALSKDTKEAVKTAKKALDESKKEMKARIAELTKMEREFDKAANDKDKRAERDANQLKFKAALNYKNYMQGCLQMVQVYRASMLTAYRQYIGQARYFGKTYIMAANKGTYKGFQKESAGFLSTVQLV